jgi:dolichol-phosphate mannosyltransferase
MVILPTYNEADNLSHLIAELLVQDIPNLHILVIDDNSPDGTGQIADDLHDRDPDILHIIHRPTKLGLGTAYITGFKHALVAGATHIVQMDADFSHSPARISDFLGAIEAQGYDVVIGSRYVPGGKLDAKWGAWRRFLSGAGNRYARWVTGVPLHDLTSGFRCFTRESLNALDLDDIRSNGYAFQIEVNYACYHAQQRIHEMPITFEDRVLGKSKMSSRIILEALWRVWQMRWRY